MLMTAQEVRYDSGVQTLRGDEVCRDSGVPTLRGDGCPQASAEPAVFPEHRGRALMTVPLHEVYNCTLLLR